MSEIDDITLARAQRGDRKAIEALVRCYQDRVYAVVARMLVDWPSDVDDVAQDAFVKVLKAIGRFQSGGPARLSTWIVTIAARTAIDALRKPRPTEALPLDNLIAFSDVEKTAADREIGRRVASWVAGLPPDQRAVLVLRAYFDLDYAEISAALEVDRGTVKSRLSRARARLRDLMRAATGETR